MTKDNFISTRPNNSHRRKSDYQVGTQIHASETPERKQSLERYLNSLGPHNDFQVNLSKSATTARIQMPQTEDGHPVVTIPTYDDLESPFDSISNEVFRAMIQYANALHEFSHHKYTDQYAMTEAFEDLQEHISNEVHDEYNEQVTAGFTGYLLKLCKDIWNAIEDGAIEEAVREEYSSPHIAQRLAIKNRAFIAQPNQEISAEQRKNVSYDMAIHTAAMDLAKVDTGKLRRLVDKEDDSWQFGDEEHKETFYTVYDELQDVVVDALTMGNPKARTDRVFDFLKDTVVPETLSLLPEPEETPDREQLRNRQRDDIENNNSGGSQQQAASNALSQKSKQNVKKERNIESIDSKVQQQQDGEKSDSDREDRNDGGETQGKSRGEESENTDGSAEGQTTESGDDSETTANQQSNALNNAGGNQSSDSVSCPNCSSDTVSPITMDVDKEIGARVDAPFTVTEDWIGSVEFVLSTEKGVCGFRVQTTGTVPTQPLEQGRYTVFDIPTGIEILEPFDDYPDTVTVNGYHCDDCSHEWVPVIGGE